MSYHVDPQRIRQDGPAAAIDQEVASHIQSCASCREAIRLLAASLGLPPAGGACADVQAHLAGYIELERQDPIAAARGNPAIWWHLWSCPECAGTYRLTHDLLAAAARGEVPPLPGAEA